MVQAVSTMGHAEKKDSAQTTASLSAESPALFLHDNNKSWDKLSGLAL